MKQVLIVAALLLAQSAVADTLAENQARFGDVTGDVEILSQGAVDWIPAHTGLPIEPGDQIRVGEDAEAELSITDKALWIAESGTELIMGSNTGTSGRLSMSRGSLAGKVEPKAGQIGNWVFETPVGVCAVRGTEFVLTHAEDAGTQLAVIKGAVEMQPADSPTETFPPILVQAREQGMLQKRARPVKLGAHTPEMSRRAARFPRMAKRFHARAAEWSPLTPEYRMELRRKMVAPPPKPRPRRAQPNKRSSQKTR